MLLILIGFGIWHGMRTREPRYKDKPMSFWITGVGCTPNETQEAMDHLGTNCIPTLLRMVKAEDSPAKERFDRFVHSFHIPIKVENAEVDHILAIHGFGLLGSQAQGAVGPLIELYDENSSPERQFTVLRSLGAIGPAAQEGIPTLLREMNSTNDSLRANSTISILRMGKKSDVVVPVLINALTNQDKDVRQATLFCIREFGTNASSAAPALIDLYHREQNHMPKDIDQFS